MKIRDERELVLEYVERGVQYGVRRFYKHRDDAPDEQTLQEMFVTVTNSVTDALDDVFVFEKCTEE